MVVKGKGKPPGPPPRPSPTPLITKIASLQKKPNKEKALDLLHRVAVSVAPIMREHSFKVGLLSEFFPKDKRLLGLNVNHGQKVLVRLRSPFNEHQFLPFSEVLGTALHELVHNSIGPHNKSFYDFLEKLKQRYYEISMRSAYEVTGYFSQVERLGASSGGGGGMIIDVNQARVNKLAAKKTYVSEARKLGGLDDDGDDSATSNCGRSAGLRKNTPRSKKDLKELVREAAERRAKDNKWCAEEQGLSSKEDMAPDDEELEVKVIKEIIYNDHDGKRSEGRVIKQEDVKSGLRSKQVSLTNSSLVRHSPSAESASKGTRNAGIPNIQSSNKRNVLASGLSDLPSTSTSKTAVKKKPRIFRQTEVIDLDSLVGAENEEVVLLEENGEKSSPLKNQKKGKERVKEPVEVIDLT